MTQENKELLLKYLCAVLPYDIKLMVIELNKDVIFNIKGIDLLTNNVICVKSNSSTIFNVPIKSVKLYLRSMLSMTEEEKEEYQKLIWTRLEHYTVFWLLENHFDFMGLIPKNLAIEVNESNNPYK